MEKIKNENLFVEASGGTMEPGEIFTAGGLSYTVAVTDYKGKNVCQFLDENGNRKYRITTPSESGKEGGKFKMMDNVYDKSEDAKKACFGDKHDEMNLGMWDEAMS